MSSSSSSSYVEVTQKFARWQRSRSYSRAETRKPHVPAAGSPQMMSPGLGGRELDHQADVARRAEVAVLTRRDDFGEPVLIDVALCVAVLHRGLVDEVDSPWRAGRGWEW